MMKNTGMQNLICVMVLLGTSFSVQAGVIFQVETTYHSGGSASSDLSEMSVDGRQLKMEFISGGNANTEGEALFFGDRREMILIDHGEREYIVVDEGAAQQIGGQVNEAMKEMEKALAEMDPQQRAMVEQMMKRGMGPGGMPGLGEPPKKPVTEYRRTEDRETKEGYPCVRYEVLEDGQKVRELWVTEWGNVEGGSQFRDVFLDMARFWEDLREAFSSASGTGAGFFGMHENPMDGFVKANGFPVISREFEGGVLQSESVLKSAKQQNLDPAAFEPPKGYRLRTMGPQ